MGTGKEGLISLGRRKGEYEVYFMFLIGGLRERIGLDRLAWGMIFLDKQENILSCVEIILNKNS